MKTIRKHSVVILIAMIMVACSVFLVSCGREGENLQNNLDTGGTNVQEAGIDEADIVKLMNDGKLYNMQTDGISIIQTNEGEMTLVGCCKYSKMIPQEMYINGDKLIAIGGLNNVFDDGGSFSYSERYGNMSTSIMYIYDLSEMEEENFSGELSVIYSYRINASYQSSRIYLSSNSLYVAFVMQNDSSKSFKENGQVKEIEYSFDVSTNKDDRQSNAEVAVFVKINLDDEQLNAHSVMYNGAMLSTIYASEYGLYPVFTMYRTSYQRSCMYLSRYTMVDTVIIKIDPDNLLPKRKAVLEDTKIYGRYAIKDYGDYVFVVGHGGFSGQNGTTIYAFDGNMNLVSQIGGIAKNEEVKSVRFDETETERTCYVVTFRNVDPLFKIDISNANNMELLGELKIEGYSAYLHVVGDNKVIGIGYDGTEFGLNGNIKVTLFDTSGGDPVEINSIIIPYISQCEVITNPKALFINKELGVFGFSLIRYNSAGERMQGFYLFAVDNVELVDVAFISNYPNGIVDNSYLDGENLVYDTFRRTIYRAMYSNGYLYTVSDDRVVSYKLEDLLNNIVERVNILFTSLDSDVSIH